MSFHWLDLILVLGIGASAVYATLRGFVRETLSIIAWVVAILAALYFGPDMADLLKGHLPDGLSDVAGYLVVFLLVVGLLSFFTFHLSGSVKRSPVGPVDRVLGFAFGVVRGLAVAGIIYLIFASFEPPPDQPDWMTRAQLYPVLHKSGEMLDRLIPDRLLKHMTDHGKAKAKAALPVVPPPPAAAAPVPASFAPPQADHNHKKNMGRPDAERSSGYDQNPAQTDQPPRGPTAAPPRSHVPTPSAATSQGVKTETPEAEKPVTTAGHNETLPKPRQRPAHKAPSATSDTSASDSSAKATAKPDAAKPKPATTKATDTKHRNNAYGEKDREALDKLIDQSGKGNSGKP